MAAVVLAVAAVGAGCRDSPPAESGATPPPAALFTEISAEVGLDFVHASGVDGSYFMPESIGSGGALFDYDGDGDLDLYLVTSGPHGPAAKRGPIPPNRLFRQEADGSLVDRTEAAGLGDRSYGMGVAVGDYDNDGDPDLYLTNFGADAFYRNDGGGRFSEVARQAGLGAETWSTAACFFDADADGDLDLYVATYVDYDPPKACTDRTGRPEYCGPGVFRGEPDLLYINSGDGAFVDGSAAAGIGAVANRGLGLACLDLDGDGLQDVYVANDGEPNNVWINAGDGRFEDQALLLGAGLNALGKAEASMGVAVGDVDGDLRLDLFISHLDRETNTLYRNRGMAGFDEATAVSRLGPDSLPYTGFGTAFMDADLDGDLDLLVANGRVRRGDAVAAGGAGDDPLAAFLRDYAQPNLYFENLGAGVFANRPAAGGELCSRLEVSRGLLIGDLDLDGDADVLLTQCNGPARLYRNLSAGDNRWTAVRAFDGSRRRDALGALVRVQSGERTQVQPVISAVSYLAAVEPLARFGLGAGTGPVRIEVAWPGGARSAFTELPANRRLTVYGPGGWRP